MKIVYVCLIALLAGGLQTACNDHDADDEMRAAEVGSKDGCNIVFNKEVGIAVPHVIVAADVTPKNDALLYYKRLGDENQEGITGSIYQQAMKSFKCVAPAAIAKKCVKHVRVSFGVGHLTKLKKDLFIVQAERSCKLK